MAHPYAKEAKDGHSRKLKAYGGETGKEPLTHAGLPALNTDQQAGRAPLNSKEYIPPEVTARAARKKGGRVSGAESLKRLDKAPRKGAKIPTGTRKEEIPTGTTEQVDFDLTNKFEPGEMNETSLRKKGGKVMKHDDEKEDRALVKKMVKGDALTGKCSGGRMKRADGGGAWGDYGASEGGGKSSGSKKGSGKTTVNIMIGGQQPQQQGGMDPMLLAALAGAGGAGGPPPGAPPAPPPGAMPPPPPAAAMGAPPPAPVGGPPQMPPGGMPMPRASGGRAEEIQVKYRKPGKTSEGYPKMDFGSGGGFGRKAKIDSYGTKGPKGDSV